LYHENLRQNNLIPPSALWRKNIPSRRDKKSEKNRLLGENQAFFKPPGQRFPSPGTSLTAFIFLLEGDSYHRPPGKMSNSRLFFFLLLYHNA
jgi:hypothetical protein|tara:strand:+ start:784 stop:1059 length:276 start_codon:yes stop_codon:yes gene_type:complete